MGQGNGRPPASSTPGVWIAELTRRTVAARRVALVLCLLGLPGTIATTLRAGVGPVSFGMVAATLAFAGAFGLGFTRHRDKVAPVVLSVMLLQHIAMVALTPRDMLSPTPYFTTISIFIAAMTLDLPGVVLAIVGAFTALAAMAWLRLEGSPGDATTAFETTIPLLLAALMAAIAVMQSVGARRALAKQIEREAELERTRSEARASAEYFELIAANTDDLVLLLDRNGVVTFASPSHARVLGRSSSELVGKPASTLVLPEDWPRADGLIRDVFEGKGGRQDVRVVGRDGAILWFDITGRSVVIDDLEQAAFAARDITERRRLADELEESRRLEALGRLSSAVAHDFNNLLTVVGSGADGALASLGDERAVRAELEDILRAVERAGALTRQLLLFGKEQSLALSRLDVAAVIRGLVPLCEKLVDSSIEFSFSGPEEPLFVFADATHVEQVLMNLVVNARDALLPAGGKLRIEVRACSLEDPQNEEGRPAVALRVIDTGAGIPESIRRRMFEPYFTTKEEGKGTGLGLSTVYGIVTRLGGTIEVESEVGRGTTFTVLLPAARGVPRAA